MNLQMSVLEKVSLVVKEINEAETNLRDASFEMEAKRQGIDPEQLREQAADVESTQQLSNEPQL